VSTDPAESQNYDPTQRGCIRFLTLEGDASAIDFHLTVSSKQDFSADCIAGFVNIYIVTRLGIQKAKFHRRCGEFKKGH
jgi:hypothetical protein